MTNDQKNPQRAGMSRRDLLRRGAIGGGLVWAAPAITTLQRAAAQGSPTGEITFVGATSNRSEDDTISINRPAAAVVGDLLIAAITVESGTNELDVPSGWTEVGTGVNQSSNMGMRIYRRAADGSASYSWNTNGKKTSGGIIALRGAHATTPINGTPTSDTGSSGTMIAPSVTTTVANAWLLCFFGSKEKEANHSQPPGMTRQYLTAEEDFRSSGNTEPLGAAGATNSRSSGTSDGDSWVARSIAIAPA